VWALGTFPDDTIHFPVGIKEADLDFTMPEGTDGTLNNCDLHDIYEVKKYKLFFFLPFTKLPSSIE